ncbi:MAG: flavodoxin-dependent (E)-4-hydroxy-3-methylbut-2-enyl-diphosphate synthase [Spirochaetes bacterium]|nr:flavodoxin-dependent (E)-4-hydroxy-3-methylbut-2-enyl-diphosphate synthase [Spirochaetota bacterium]
MIPIKRHRTRKVYIGDVPVGGGSPITVQSMTNTDSHNIKELIEQILELEKAGCSLIRIALPDMDACDSIPALKKRIHIPLIGDVHFDHRIAIRAIEKGIDALRLNPGNIREKEKVKGIVKLAKKRKIPIRIGVNSGSVDRRKYSSNSPESLIKSALDHIKILEKEDFSDIIVSLKSTDVLITIEAYKKFATLRDYPLHIGITEAGTRIYGSLKSAVGLGILLYLGLGDTIRVSLSASPVEEVTTGYRILRSLGIYTRSVEVISCPTCARTAFDVENTALRIETLVSGIRKRMKIAIMGCLVNGPGEARDADIGVAGSKNEVLLFKKGRLIKKIRPDRIEQEIMEWIKKS